MMPTLVPPHLEADYAMLEGWKPLADPVLAAFAGDTRLVCMRGVCQLLAFFFDKVPGRIQVCLIYETYPHLKNQAARWLVGVQPGPRSVPYIDSFDEAMAKVKQLLSA